MQIILASQSPRRKELLKQIFPQFIVYPSGIDESTLPLQDPSAFATTAATLKAQHVAHLFPHALVIGADTIVVLHNTIFGKPTDYEDAKKILSTLSGTTHEVITGLALYHHDCDILIRDYATSKVTIKKLTEEDIHQYLLHNDFLDKAGAYAIQDAHDRFIQKIEGEYENVVGLPLVLLRKLLRDFEAIRIKQRL